MKRLGEMLFGPDGLQRATPKQPTEIERLEQEAARCRDLAANGMRPRAFKKQAEWCDRRIAELKAAQTE